MEYVNSIFRIRELAFIYQLAVLQDIEFFFFFKKKILKFLALCSFGALLVIRTRNRRVEGGGCLLSEH